VPEVDTRGSCTRFVVLPPEASITIAPNSGCSSPATRGERAFLTAHPAGLPDTDECTE
jgi:hypothetical protein